MKNVLLLSLCIMLMSTVALSQEEKSKNSLEPKQEVNLKKESVKLKPAKKVVKAPLKKNIKVKSIRKKEILKREED